MGHVFKGILKTVGVVVHRVDAPFIPLPVMACVPDPVQHRISHQHIRGL